MTIAPRVAEKWIYTLLQSDATIQANLGSPDMVLNTDVPDDQSTWPIILFGVYTNEDMMGVGPTRIKTTLQYVIRAVGRDVPYSALDTLASRADLLLHGASGSAPGGGTILSCIRIRPFSLTETTADPTVRYRHLGGIYQLEVQEP